MPIDPISFYSRHRISPPSLLFNELLDTFYFAKNCDGQFVWGNRLLQEKFGLASAEEVIGKTDHDFFSRDIADRIREDDLRVMRSGIAVKNKLEVIGGANGRLYWLFTTKAPLRNKQGKVVGVEGFSKDAQRSLDMIEPYHAFRACIEYLQQHFTQEVNIGHLAELSCMSLSTFERRFKKSFARTPKQYIKHMKVHEACRLLAGSHSIKRAAIAAGFCDQSYFTKEFKSVVGLTPKQYLASLATP
ncbi:helix-turn-helix domain-containing protein [Duganella sp. BuS-21]|uniref:AraC family transcriptional regulator n=1 Tax=Duganella sp. BuS-21 TaxID=2943848 RepID=UPI0035A57B2A